MQHAFFLKNSPNRFAIFGNQSSKVNLKKNNQQMTVFRPPRSLEVRNILSFFQFRLTVILIGLNY